MFVMLEWIRRQFRSRRDSHPPKPRRVPIVDQLESRELQTVVAGRSALAVNPGLLPNTGQYETVRVVGAIATTSTVPPQAFFMVTDEYRRVEPRGSVTLTEIPPKYGFHRYAFDFSIRLLAQRSTGTVDGRHYNIYVGAKDANNTDGRAVSVYVPKQFPRSAIPTKPPTTTTNTTK